MVKRKTEAENNALVEQTSRAMQERYVNALMEKHPGLGGETSKKVAYELANTGISPNEAFALIKLVYSPSDLAGKGQANRIKHFAEAVEQRYGEVALYNASQNVESFRRLLAHVTDAVDARDTINEQLKAYETGSSITFRDALAMQAVGVDAETLISYHDILMSDYGYTPIAATMRIKSAIASLESRNTGMGNLETLVFPTGLDGFVQQVMTSDSIGDQEE